MASNTTDNTTFGATIVPTTPSKIASGLQTPMLESPALTPVVTRDGPQNDYTKTTSPHSPFYEHPPSSLERVHSRQTSKNDAHTFEKDLEAGNITPLSDHSQDNPFASKISLERNKECKMWPSRQTLMQAKQASKQKKRQRKGCTGFAPLREKWDSFTKRQRLMVKLLLALLIVGVIVAIAVGVTEAVHGGVYGAHGTNQIGHDGS